MVPARSPPKVCARTDCLSREHHLSILVRGHRNLARHQRTNDRNKNSIGPGERIAVLTTRQKLISCGDIWRYGRQLRRDVRRRGKVPRSGAPYDERWQQCTASSLLVMHLLRLDMLVTSVYSIDPFLKGMVHSEMLIARVVSPTSVPSTWKH